MLVVSTPCTSSSEAGSPTVGGVCCRKVDNGGGMATESENSDVNGMPLYEQQKERRNQIRPTCWVWAYSVSRAVEHVTGRWG